jgi:hypothetical protein
MTSAASSALMSQLALRNRLRVGDADMSRVHRTIHKGAM